MRSMLRLSMPAAATASIARKASAALCARPHKARVGSSKDCTPKDTLCTQL